MQPSLAGSCGSPELLSATKALHRCEPGTSIKSLCAEKQRLLTEDAHAATAGYETWIMSEANGQLRPDEPQQGGAGGLVTKVAVFYTDADGQKHIGALNVYKHYPQVSHGRYCNFDAPHYIPIIEMVRTK